MDTRTSTLHGIWLPLVTPFRDNELDEMSLRRLVRHYAGQPVEGLFLGATTGEGMTLDRGEVERLVHVVADELGRLGRRMPLYLGQSGSDTRKGVADLAWADRLPVDGYLIACPHYTRPSQAGLFAHFSALATATERPILIYNIPYRTGVNMSNETLLRLAERPNVVGVKDCCADAAQSFDLMRACPPGFAVLTGEDGQFFTAMTQGAQGGIMASAHVETERFASVYRCVTAGDLPGALAQWRALADLPRLLFAEPNPAPIKHWLWRSGLIQSPEVRLPMTGVSDGLAARLDHEMARRNTKAA